jgi:hypothetical protein
VPTRCSTFGLLCGGAVHSHCVGVLHRKHRHMLAANLQLNDLWQQWFGFTVPCGCSLDFTLPCSCTASWLTPETSRNLERI